MRLDCCEAERRQRRANEWLRQKYTRPRFRLEIQPGVRLTVSTDSEFCRLLFEGGFETDQRYFVNRFLRPGDTFADVGANIGLYAVIARDAMGQNGRVLAYEPEPVTFGRLQANAVSRQVECNRIALGDGCGEALLTVSRAGYDGWNSLVHQSLPEPMERIPVAVDRWDRIACASGLVGTTTLIKVDIEGGEWAFLAGAKQTLTRPDAPVLMMEIEDRHARAAGTTAAAICQLLRDWGYELFDYVHPEGLSPIDSETGPGLIATKDREGVARRLNERAGPLWML